MKIVLGLLSFLILRVEGQSTKAELFGMVRDAAGLRVSGATVDLVNVATEVRVSVESEMDGAYHFFALSAGSYRITVGKAGFATLHRDGIAIRVGDRVTVDLDLKVGDISETVEVTAAAPLLQASRGTASFVVEQRRVVTLPLDGRNFVP